MEKKKIRNKISKTTTTIINNRNIQRKTHQISIQLLFEVNSKPIICNYMDVLLGIQQLQRHLKLKKIIIHKIEINNKIL